MEAMILAAGEGKRLLPLTERLPKALVPVRGRPLLAHVMDRLVAAGATRVIVNASRHAEQIEAYLGSRAPKGVEIALSREPDGPYDTGGGLVAASRLFRKNGPILLHAVDVLSNIPLDWLLAEHRAARERHGEKLLATLAVQNRPAARRLLFDADGLLGWERRAGSKAGREAAGFTEVSRRVRAGAGNIRDWAFAGIHVIEPVILDVTDRTGVFPIWDLYLDLAARGFRISSADVSAHEWRDVGTPERLREAEAGGW
jgi:NDP-sugar pyrophosphorylase family protein